MTAIHIDLIENRVKKLESLVNTLVGQQEHDKNRITYVNQLVIDLENKLDKEIKELVSCMATHHQFNKLIERIEKLEKHVHTKFTVNPITNELELLLPTEKRLTEILREQLPGHEIEIKFVGSVGVGQDNKQCYMSAKHAMKAFFEGYKLTRKEWSYDEEHNNNFIKLGDDYSVDVEWDDLIANDWYII